MRLFDSEEPFSEAGKPKVQNDTVRQHLYYVR
jgi:hypothetical protein